MSQSIAEILAAAKAKIDTPEKWTKGVGARDAGGTAVDPQESWAVCFCSLGAVGVATDDITSYEACIGYLRRAIGDNPIIDWNDAPYRTHAEVMAAFDRAIQLAKEGA